MDLDKSPSSRLVGERPKRRSLRATSRLSASDYPSRSRTRPQDDMDDVTAPGRGNAVGSQYMHQSVVSMITAASRRKRFDTRFDDTSDSEGDIAEEDEAGPGEEMGQSIVDLRTSSRPKDVKSSRKLEEYGLPSGAPTRRGGASQPSPLILTTHRHRHSTHRSDDSPSSVSTNGSTRSNPHNVSVMSRILTAQAEYDQTTAGIHHAEQTGSGKEDESGRTDILAEKLKDIFNFDKPEAVVAEFPCWLLQSVLLQGYLYITELHLCFYAYLPRTANVIAKSGWLLKRGRHSSSFKKHWFILKGDVLSYYSSPSELYFPQGNIDLRYAISASYTGDQGKQKGGERFCVSTDQRTYHLQAASSIVAKEWVKALQKTIFRSRNEGDSVKISLPVKSIIDIEESPVVEVAETVKIRVIESEDTFAIDEYFFTFFTQGEDALNALGLLLDQTQANNIPEDQNAPRANTTEIHQFEKLKGPFGRPQHSPSLVPLSSTDRTSPRQSTKTHELQGKLDVANDSIQSTPSPGARQDSEATFFSEGPEGRQRSSSTAKNEFASPSRGQSFEYHSVERETDSSAATMSPPLDPQMSASQILDRSDVFHPPTAHDRARLPALAEKTSATSDDGTLQSLSAKDDNNGKVHATAIAIPSPKQNTSDQPWAIPRIASSPTPTFQDIVKVGSYPLQQASAVAEYLKTRSSTMGRLLATESMSYLEKVSGMWAGSRQHYGANEGILPDDKGVDPEDEEANVGHGDRFRSHFALPGTEKLQATFYGYLHRVLPLYGKIYVGTRKFCFRSLLPGTRTKLVLPLKDVENVDKEKGFRFGYQGLVLVIRGHEELFFEFRTLDSRDDCAITLLRCLESARYMEESGIIAKEDEDGAQTAKNEYKMLKEARRTTMDPTDIIAAPDRRAGVDRDEQPTIFVDDINASLFAHKPTKSLRITCLTIGSRGDVQPYIALCEGLRAEGHKVRIATHAEFEPWIRKHGIEFARVEGDPAELMRICVENGMFTYSFLREATSKFRGWIDELLSSSWQACQDTDVLIESPSAMAGIHIAEALQIPYFRAFTMPWTRTRAYPHAFAVPEQKTGGAYNYFSYVIFDNVFWKAIASQVNRWRKLELRLRSTNLDRMQPNKVPFLYNFSPSVVPPPLDFSEWVQVTGYWFLDEANDWTAPQPLLDFIEKARSDGKKLVYIGFGSIVVSDPAALTKTVVDSVLKADVRCILSKGWSDRLGDPTAVKVEVTLPPEIYQITAAPHDWLFKQIDAAVHHGGAGTTGASLRAGVPTVIKPFFGDQFFFGSRVVDLGVGLCLNKVNVAIFSRALWEATHDQRMIVKAKMLGEQIRKENGVATAIRALWRDLDYAKDLVKARAGGEGPTTGLTTEDDNQDSEESWTVIGKEGGASVPKGTKQSTAMSRGLEDNGVDDPRRALHSVHGQVPSKPRSK